MASIASRERASKICTELALVANCEDEHGILGRAKIIERDIARFAARDDQLAQAALDGSADQRVTREHLDRVHDRFESGRDGVGALRREEVRNSIEACERPR